MTTLKEETIKGLQNDKAFNMATFGTACTIIKKNKGRKNYCGTASCIAGHIVAAAARLGRKVPEEVLAEYGHSPTKDDLYFKGTDLMNKLGLDDDSGTPTARAARYIWARSYGAYKANELDFYANNFAPNCDLEDITAEQAIEYLKSL